jgi:SAM-dependent methyltransferase
MPDYLKTTFRNMITKDAHLDGWLHYWHGLLYEAEGKAEEAAREFAEALMVSYPAPAALVSLHRLSDRQAPAGMAAWSGRRLAGAEVVLEWGSGAGLLLRQLPGRAKIGIEGDVRLRKQASLEAGIDAVELAEELPDGAADAWVSDLALERAPAPLAVLQSMARKLKAGGKALVSVSLHRAGETPDGKTLYAWTPETLRNLFQAAGYAVKEVSLAAADATAAGTGDARRILLEAVKASAEAPAGPGRGTGDWAMVPSGNAAPAAAAKGTDPKDIPVALVAYNRPEHTRQVLKALADHGIRNLHVFLDGPKGNGDEQAVRETRRVVEGFPGIRPEIHAEERNRGLAKSIMAAANTLFADHEHMALLEDDCVPQKHCFDFMARALDRYRDDSHVFGISGYSVPMTPEILSQYPYDAYFCPRIGSWGWATWKRAWNLMETDIVAACRKALDARIDLSQGGNDIPHSLEGLLQGHVKDVWTLHWVLTVYLNRGQFLYPTVSHIDNIGMDGTGVHCGRTDKYDTTLAQHPSTRFPESIAPDPRTLARFRSFYDLPALQAAGRA